MLIGDLVSPYHLIMLKHKNIPFVPQRAQIPNQREDYSLSPRPVVGTSKEAMTGVEVKAEVRSSGFRFRLIWAKFPDLQCPSCIDTGQVHVPL